MELAAHKNTLSRLLAQENINVRIDPGAHTAAFDVQGRNLILPNWSGISNYLLDMLIVHEVGHALYTGKDAWQESIPRLSEELSASLGAQKAQVKQEIPGYINIIEDCRIDKLMKQRYPGTKKDYIEGHKELFSRDFFGFDKNNKDVNDYNFIDRINILYKGGSLLGIKFSPEENLLVDKINNLNSFDDVTALVKEIYTLSFENRPVIEPPQKSKTKAKTKSSSPGDSKDKTKGKSSQGPQDDEEGSGGSGDESGDQDDGDQESEKSKDSEGDNSEGEGKQPGDSSDSMSSKTSGALDDFAKNKASQGAGQCVNAIYLPVAAPNKCVDDYKLFLESVYKYQAQAAVNPIYYNEIMAETLKWKKQENSAISYMVKEFETRKAATNYARTSVSKTGKLNTNKIHSYIYNDDLFKRMTRVNDGKNHGFVMLLDWSGSMSSSLPDTLKQLFVLVMFCRRINVPFDVYLFRNRNSACDDTSSEVGDFKLSDQKLFKNEFNLTFESDFKLRNIFSSRMKKYEINASMTYLSVIGSVFKASPGTYLRKNGYIIDYDVLHSTPLLQSVFVMKDIIESFRKKNKIEVCNLVVMTDGDANGFSLTDSSGRGCGGRLGAGYNGAIAHIIDPVSKTRHKIEGSLDSSSILKVLLDILRTNLHINIVGFFLIGRGVQSGIYLNQEQKTTMREEKFAEISDVKKTGYDSYFIVRSNSNDDDENDVVATAYSTTKQLPKLLIDNLKAPRIKRNILNRFIDRIISYEK